MPAIKRLLIGLLGTAAALAPLSADAEHFKTLYTFPYAGPAALFYDRGVLYGAENEVGSYDNVFAFTLSTAAMSVIYNFTEDADGLLVNTLIENGGKFYGTTYLGGDPECGCGVVFALDPQKGVETVLHQFQDKTDGASPVSLVMQKGVLYGTDNSGGGSILFSVDPTSGNFTSLHLFGNNERHGQGAYSLAARGDTIYGTTASGDQDNCGGIFAFHTTSGKIGNVDMFSCPSPNSVDLIPAGNALYGVTQLGGNEGRGSIYAVDLATKEMTTLYSFTGGKDGRWPGGSLIDVDGVLYGTTTRGGGLGCSHQGCGTIFSYDLATGTETVLYRFTGGTDAETPIGLIAHGNRLYGFTNPNPGTGTLFEFTP